MPEVREVELRRRRLNAAFGRVERLPASADREELEAECARHLCVLISGFVERGVGEIILAYAQGKAARPLVSFIETRVRGLRNLDKDRLLAVVGSLDAGWRVEIEEYVADERQAALNSVVGLRNDIAHGGGGQVSFGQVVKYWAAIQQVVDKVADVLLSRPQSGERKARKTRW